MELESASKNLLEFALPTWYNRLRNLTIKSVFLDLPQDFVQYLTSDGCVLPAGCSLPSMSCPRTCEEEADEEEDEDRWNEDNGEDEVKPPAFPDLVKQISEAITELGPNGVFPKLNWSAPKGALLWKVIIQLERIAAALKSSFVLGAFRKLRSYQRVRVLTEDAVWITATSCLSCSSPAEVIILLKSSDFITHDITLVSEFNANRSESLPPVKCTLCLRAWHDIPPSSEFRCFVREGKLVGVCQRDVHTHYPYLLLLREQLLQDIEVFLSGLHVLVRADNYVCDVSRGKEDKMLLIDLNPFSLPTDPLLFTWEELGVWEGPATILLVESGLVQPSALHSCRVPKDFVDLSTGADIHKFLDFFHSKGLGSS